MTWMNCNPSAARVFLDQLADEQDAEPTFTAPTPPARGETRSPIPAGCSNGPDAVPPPPPHRDRPSSQFPQTGVAALTTVEARGTTASPESSAVSVTEGLGGRAAGAQLTGQRQDGPSQGPACEQYPRVAHGGAGPSSEADDDTPVGCRCNGGRIYLKGIMPAACPHCEGRGTLPRSRYRELFGAAAA